MLTIQRVSNSGTLSPNRWPDWSGGCNGFLANCLESETLRSWPATEFSHRSIRSLTEWKITRDCMKWMPLRESQESCKQMQHQCAACPNKMEVKDQNLAEAGTVAENTQMRRRRSMSYSSKSKCVSSAWSPLNGNLLTTSIKLLEHSNLKRNWLTA